MTKKQARVRMFRQAWLPAVAGVDPAQVATTPLTYLLELYAPVYYLGLRGMLVDQQLRAVKQYDSPPTGPWSRPDTVFEQSMHRFNRKMLTLLSDNAAEQYRYLVVTFDKSPEPELPNVKGYLDYLVEQDRYPLGSHRDISLSNGLNTLVTVSANLTRLQRRAELRPVAKAYEKFCDKWGLPLD